MRQGFHVLIVATRGTGGSGGDFRPFRDDVRDAPAVLSWLREQPWFDGRLATIGPSYLGYTQLALATDPPPELRAMVLLAPAAHAGAGAWDHGVFRLQHALVVAAGIDTYHRGFAAFVRGSVRMARRLDRVARSQPLLESYLAGTGGRRVPLFEDMITHGPDDDVWAGTDLREAITNAGTATLLVGGWWDLLLDQTLDLFTRAEAAGRRPRMLLGPWTHTSMVDRAGWPSSSRPRSPSSASTWASKRPVRTPQRRPPRDRCWCTSEAGTSRPGATCRRGRRRRTNSSGSSLPTASSRRPTRRSLRARPPSSATTRPTLRRPSAVSCPLAVAPSTTPRSRRARTYSS